MEMEEVEVMCGCHLENGNNKKSLGRDSKGEIIILSLVSFEEHVAVQRETKVRTLLLHSLPEDHIAEFYHLDDAREIWLAVKARFGGNEESKKMTKTMLKQEFSEFSVSKEEGLHKGYDRFQKILSQLNQMQAKPDNDDVNLKFLRALPPSWSQVALTLKTRGGLEYLSFDDLYNKLMSLEINVKDGSSYDSRGTTVAPTHCACIGAASTNTKMVYSDQPSHSSSITYTSAHSGSIMEDVDQLEMEKLDIKWQMAMLSLSINKFQKKAGRKINFNNKDPARFDRRKARCYNCLQLGHFARKCNVKKVDEKARYSAFKISEVKTKEPKAMEYNGSDEVFDLSTPSVFDLEPKNREVKSLYERFVKADEMHEVPPLITGTFMPTSYKSYLKETQVTFGSKSNTSSINTSESNDFVSCDNSDKSSESTTYDFASCVSSPKTNDSFPTVDFKILPKSDVKDPSPTNSFPSCSFKENVKPPRNLCNKIGIADMIPCKNNFVRTKTCFVCGSKSHLIKDCDVYDNVDNFPFVASTAAYVPASSRNSLASISAGRSIPAASRNRPASIHVGRHILAGRFNKPVHFPAGRSLPTGWTNRAARPFFRPINLYFDNVSWPGIYDHMSINEGRWGFVVKSSAVLTKEFQLPDESQVVLRIPRRHDLYTFNLSYIQPEQHINCLLAKASLEESTKWHRRMAHMNFKTINKLAKNGLVEGLPLKLFTNEHNCVACNKGKQHQASYKAIFDVWTIFEPLKLLHMDRFGPTSIRSIDQTYYSLVVTNDFSRFSWTFFLGTKDETFYILMDFSALIENQLNKKVKAIRCDNGTKFQNAKLIDLYGEKEIKRDYSNARTPQQNRVAERKNRTLIEAARSMLADSKLPTMFWTEAVSTACYVLNRVSITNPHNKTPYELLSGKVSNISHLKPFGCQLTILNTSDHLGKLKGKANKGFLVGYAANSTQDTNVNACTQDDDSESECDEQAILFPSFPSNSFSGPKVNPVSATIENHLDYAEELARLQKQEHEAHSAAVKYGFEFSNETAEMLHQAKIKTRRNLVLAAGDPAGSIVSTGGIPTGSVPAGSVPVVGVLAGSVDSAGFGDLAISEYVFAVFNPDHADNSTLPPGHSLGSSEHSTRFLSSSDLRNHQPTAGIFSSSSYDDDFCADVTNLASNVAVDPVATKRVNTIHPQSQIIGELQSPVQTRLLPCKRRC
nr:putative ribonuclease H-like domain-containing protein [Tanacetum cinerariifolium]